jgi:hypothetical protein
MNQWPMDAEEMPSQNKADSRPESERRDIKSFNGLPRGEMPSQNKAASRPESPTSDPWIRMSFTYNRSLSFLIMGR